MDKIIELSKNERLKLFQDASAALNIPVAMVEKDFWVCWILGKLFGNKDLSNILLFKGGTSLSKCYRLIERFSEDLDIILAKEEVLGKDSDLFKLSKKKQKEFSKEIHTLTAKYISTKLKDKITAILGETVKVYTDDEYEKEDDNTNLHIVYPKTVTDKYLRPDILLEIGIMSAWVPNELCKISSYLEDAYPELEFPTTIIPTIKAQRTFWDKATILHREFYRPETTNTPARYSRHYYDLYKMSCSPIKDTALADLELLSDVVDRRDKLYHCTWACYDLAKLGSMRLLPNSNNENLVKKDYQIMQEMIFGNIPDWEEILSSLHKLEDEINSMY